MKNKKPVYSVYLKKLLYRIPERETAYDKNMEKQYWKYIWSDDTKGEGSIYRSQRENLGCDVELGNIGDTMKYGTILLVGGGLAYAMWKFNLFGGLKWLKDAFHDLKLAPQTISIFEDNELNQRVDNIDKIIDVLKKKADNFDKDYGSLNSEWQKLRGATINALGKESYKKTFYESAKMSYFGSKSTKEKTMLVLDNFRTKALLALRQLQAKKGFKIKGNWTVVDGLNCIPCLF